MLALGVSTISCSSQEAYTPQIRGRNRGEMAVSGLTLTRQPAQRFIKKTQSWAGSLYLGIAPRSQWTFSPSQRQPVSTNSISSVSFGPIQSGIRKLHQLNRIGGIIGKGSDADANRDLVSGFDLQARPLWQRKIDVQQSQCVPVQPQPNLAHNLHRAGKRQTPRLQTSRPRHRRATRP